MCLKIHLQSWKFQFIIVFLKHCISCLGVNEILHVLMHIKPLKITEEHLAVLTVECESLVLCMGESHGITYRLHFTPKCEDLFIFNKEKI